MTLQVCGVLIHGSREKFFALLLREFASLSVDVDEGFRECPDEHDADDCGEDEQDGEPVRGDRKEHVLDEDERDERGYETDDNLSCHSTNFHVPHPREVNPASLAPMVTVTEGEMEMKLLSIIFPCPSDRSQ